MTVIKGYRKPTVKYNIPTTEGSCPFCHKRVKALEAHIKIKHKGQKFSKSGKLVSL